MQNRRSKEQTTENSSELKEAVYRATREDAAKGGLDRLSADRKWETRRSRWIKNSSTKREQR